MEALGLHRLAAAPPSVRRPWYVNAVPRGLAEATPANKVSVAANASLIGFIFGCYQFKVFENERPRASPQSSSSYSQVPRFLSIQKEPGIKP